MGFRRQSRHRRSKGLGVPVVAEPQHTAAVLPARTPLPFTAALSGQATQLSRAMTARGRSSQTKSCVDAPDPLTQTRLSLEEVAKLLALVVRKPGPVVAAAYARRAAEPVTPASAG